MATDALAAARRERPRRARTVGRPGGSHGSDRLTVLLLTIAGFLVVLALLAHELPATSSAARPRVVVLRRIYRTTVVETMAGGTGGGGTSVTQSVSSSGSNGGAPAPTTHVS